MNLKKCPLCQYPILILILLHRARKRKDQFYFKFVLLLFFWQSCWKFFLGVQGKRCQQLLFSVSLFWNEELIVVNFCFQLVPLYFSSCTFKYLSFSFVVDFCLELVPHSSPASFSFSIHVSSLFGSRDLTICFPQFLAFLVQRFVFFTRYFISLLVVHTLGSLPILKSHSLFFHFVL